MKLLLSILILLSAAVNAKALKILVTIAPQQEAVQAIAGDNAEICVLVPNGASPETYSPSAKNIRKLSDADLLFTIGVPMEKALLPKLTQVCSSIKVIDCTARMKFRELSDDHNHEHGDEASHDGKDPHVWLSIDNMIIHAQNVALAMSEFDSDNAEQYILRTNEYIKKLKAMKEEIIVMMKPLSNTKLMVFHPAFGYFTDQFGIEQVTVEKDGHSPTGKHVAELHKIVEQLRIKALFTQPQSNSSTAKAVAKDLGLKLVTLDPLPADYTDGMKTIAKTISDITK